MEVNLHQIVKYNNFVAINSERFVVLQMKKKREKIRKKEFMENLHSNGIRICAIKKAAAHYNALKWNME